MDFHERISNLRPGDIIDFKKVGMVDTDCVVTDLGNELELYIDRGDGKESCINYNQICGLRIKPTNGTVKYTNDGNGLQIAKMKGPKIDIRKGDLVDFVESMEPSRGHLSWQVVDVGEGAFNHLTVERADRAAGTFELRDISVCDVTKVKQTFVG